MKLIASFLKENKGESEYTLPNKDKKVIFKEYDPKQPFPNDTISVLQKEINKKAKDFENEWKDVKELVDACFNEYEVPIPTLYQKNRWEQYKQLLGLATKELHDARGEKYNK